VCGVHCAGLTQSEDNAEELRAQLRLTTVCEPRVRLTRLRRTCSISSDKVRRTSAVACRGYVAVGRDVRRGCLTLRHRLHVPDACPDARLRLTGANPYLSCQVNSACRAKSPEGTAGTNQSQNGIGRPPKEKPMTDGPDDLPSPDEFRWKVARIDQEFADGRRYLSALSAQDNQALGALMAEIHRSGRASWQRWRYRPSTSPTFPRTASAAMSRSGSTSR
jgi:hypothetical protein